MQSFLLEMQLLWAQQLAKKVSSLGQLMEHQGFLPNSTLTVSEVGKHACLSLYIRSPHLHQQNGDTATQAVGVTGENSSLKNKETLK